MKKTLFMLGLVVFIFGVGMSQAFAVVPSINGVLGAGADITEWDNDASYEFYLKANDVNEAGIADVYDISTVVLLQELGNVDSSKDGVYFMLTTWTTPPSLVDADQTAVRASLALFTDWDGDGISPENASFPFPPDIQFYVTNVNSGGSDPVGSDKVYWCSGAVGSCDAINGTLIWDAGGPTGSAPAGFLYARGADAIEMFLRTGTFNTPSGTPFPSTFRGCASYDNGTTQPDDVVCAQNLIPEPSTIIMTIAGLFGIAGIGKLKFWN